MGKKIIHISDIHIGSNKNRGEEYRTIFSKLSVEILKNAPIAVCITGDIFHNKIRYSGEDVQNFYYLLRLITVPVIIIPGNHDMNLNNNSDIDLISPLISEMSQRDNIHYWSKTGLYEFAGLTFLHIGLSEEITTGRIKKYIRDNPKCIVLYHGMVDGAKFGNIEVSGSKFTEEVLDSAHMIFLGDIHGHQFIRKNVAYAGSLIQQNLGETDQKGYILWDIDERAGVFKLIDNEKKYIKLDLRGKNATQTTQMLSKVPESKNILKMSIITDATGDSYMSQMKEIDAKVNHERVVKWINKHKTQPQEDYEAMLRTILKNNGGTDEQIEYIVNKYKDRIIKQKSNKWSIQTMQWNCLYRYGRGNFIDFKSINGISGIIAPNRAGKTTILDILLLGLFGRVIRGTKKRIIHFGEKNSYIKIEFMVNSDNYYIERSDDATHANVRLYKRVAPALEKKPNEKAETPCSAFEYINLSEVSTIETYKKIESLIGTYDQFLTTGLYYDGKNDIIKMDKSERFKILPCLFGLEDGNIIIKEMKSRLRELNTEVAGLKKPHEANPEKIIVEKQKSLQKLLSSAKDIQKKLDIKVQIKHTLKDIKEPAEIQREITAQKNTIKKLTNERAKISSDIKFETYKLTQDETSEYKKMSKDEQTYRDLVTDSLKKSLNLRKDRDALEKEPQSIKENKIQEINILEKNADCKYSAGALTLYSGKITQLKGQIEKNNKLIDELNAKIQNGKCTYNKLRSELRDLNEKYMQMPDVNVVFNEQVYKQKIKELSELNVKEAAAQSSGRSITPLQILDKMSRDIERAPNSEFISNFNVQSQLIKKKKRIAAEIKKQCPIDAESLGKMRTKMIYNGSCGKCKHNSSLFDEYMRAQNDERLLQVKKNKQIIEGRIEELNTPIIKAAESIKNIDAQLNTDITNLTNSITRADKERKIADLTKEIIGLEKIRGATKRTNEVAATNIYAEQLDQKFNKINELDGEIASCGEKIVKLNLDNSDLKIKLAQTETTLAELKRIGELKKEIIAVDEQDKKIQAIEDAKNKLNKIDQYREKITQINLCNRQKKITFHLEKLNDEIEQLIKLYNQSKECEPTRSAVCGEITKLTAELNNTNRIIGYLRAEIDNLSNEIKIKDEYNKTYGKLANEIDIIKLYIKSVGADGLQTEIIKNNILNIIESANEILTNITTDFKLLCDVNERQIDIVIKNNKCEIPVDMGSGFERFIIGIVLRMVLTNNIYTSPDFLMIDEGFGCMDADNLKKVQEVFTQIKEKYRYIFLISHIDTIENIIEYPIYIFKDDNVSYINTKCKSRNRNEAIGYIKQYVMRYEIKFKGQEKKKFEELSDKVVCSCGRKLLRRSLAKHVLTQTHKNKCKK